MEESSVLNVLLGRRDEFLEFLRRRVNVSADADDLLQHALLKAAVRIDGVLDESAVVPWFYQLLRNALVDHARDRARRTRILDAVPASPTLPPYETGRCSCSLALLGDLPPQYESILRRIDVAGEPLEQVAAELGLSPKTATVRLHRARKSMRLRLAEFCGTTSTAACLNCRCATA